MPYVQLSDLSAFLAPAFITQALDDNNDGVQDEGLWDLIAQQISDEIDGVIGVRYSVPLSNPPQTIVAAARVLAAERLFARRQQGEQKNPWTSRANAARAQLTLIGEGKLPLDPVDQRKDPSASVVTEPIRSAPGRGMAVL